MFTSVDHLERIVEIARLRAVQRKARFAKLKVCVFKEEMPITPYECPLLNSLRFERSESDGQLFEHHCEVDVSFGPWEAVADVYDLLHCLVTDLSAQGLIVDHQCIGVCDKHLINHYYCKRPIYEFKITWWWVLLLGNRVPSRRVSIPLDGSGSKFPGRATNFHRTCWGKDESRGTAPRRQGCSSSFPGCTSRSGSELVAYGDLVPALTWPFLQAWQSALRLMASG